MTNRTEKSYLPMYRYVVLILYFLFKSLYGDIEINCGPLRTAQQDHYSLPLCHRAQHPLNFFR